jgi:hypothetical protein
MNPEQIHQQAEQERQKEARRNSRRKKGPRQRSFTPAAADSWQVFRRIYPHQPNRLLWILLPLLLATVGITLYMVDRKQFGWMLPYIIGVALIPVVVYLLVQVRKRLQYPAYKTWRSRLGFPVNGWDRLGKSENFPRAGFWDDSLTVQVLLKSGAQPATIKLTDDILYLFTRAANGWFYTADQVQPGLAGDIRKKWQTTGPLTVTGSADGGVMGDLYLTISKQLAAVHQNTGHIEAVNLSYSKHIYKIQPEQTSD